MLASLGLIFLVGLTMGTLFKYLKLPSLLGMLGAGILLGPYAFNLLSPITPELSSDFRQIALVIILTRAGLALNIDDLKKVGRPAILMCFMPALFEMVGIVLVAPKLLGITSSEAALIGTVVAAVSPAVIVPRMLKLIEEGYGKTHSIPQIIMAGASVDDIFVIVLFTSFTGVVAGNGFSLVSLINIPISIILGLLTGIGLGLFLDLLFRLIPIGDSVKTVIMLGTAFLLVTIEKHLEGIIPISGLLAVMSLSATLLKQSPTVANKLLGKFSGLWVGAELLLFVLVGSAIKLDYALKLGFVVVIIILVGLLFRISGVYISLLKTELSLRERLFCMIAYTPKATVQAAIGSLPLALGLDCGEVVLTVAVVAILITAPLGAIGIDSTYKKLLI